MERIARVLRWVTGLSLGIGLLVLLNQLQIPYYLYYARTTSSVLISDSYDRYLFLISSACVPGTLAVSSRKLSKTGMFGIFAIWTVALLLTIVREPYGIPTIYITIMYAAVLSVLKSDLPISALGELVVSALAIPVLIEYATLYYWISSALNPQGQVGLLSAQLEANMTYSLFPLTMLMMFLLLFSWLWIPITARYAGLRGARVQNQSYHELNARLIVASLDLLVVLAILVFFYPYLAGQPWIVGVDSYINYLKPLTDLAGLAPSQAFAASYTHGLYIASLYLIELATGTNSFSIVKFAPLFLAFAAATTVFLTMVRAWGNLELAVLSSICVLLWLPTTLGIYAGIQANWAAFVLWMLFLSFYFLNRNWNLIVLVVQGVISLAIFLIHPWTWGVFLATLGLTAIISGRGVLAKRCLQGLFAALIISLPIGIAAYQLLPGLEYDLANTVQLYSFFLYHPTTLLSLVDSMAVLVFYWGSFLSPILLFICLIGAYSLATRGGLARNYLLAWIAVWCVGSIMVAPIGYNPANPAISDTELWRMLYVSPLPILLALGTEKCLNLTKPFDIIGGSTGMSRQHCMLLSAVLASFGGGLFFSSDPIVRLVIVLGTVVTLLFLVARFPKYQVTRVLIASLLILFLINAAYRSLYPLLLDSHNLLGTFQR